MTSPPRDPDSNTLIRNYLRFLRDAGFVYVQRPEVKHEDGASAHDRAEKLEELRQRIAQCTRCPLAGMGRRHVVFGEGAADADLLFVGEAPGGDEDREGRPFVGRSGQLLNRMIEEVGLSRQEVFIANIIKCRPPGNRDPEPGEIEICEPYLRAQIDLIQPRVIVALGRFAARALTQDSTGITRLRGQWRSYHDVPLMPTLHPAAVLRNMRYREAVVDDLRRAVERIRTSSI